MRDREVVQPILSLFQPGLPRPGLRRLWASPGSLRARHGASVKAWPAAPLGISGVSSRSAPALPLPRGVVAACPRRPSPVRPDRRAPRLLRGHPLSPRPWKGKCDRGVATDTAPGAGRVTPAVASAPRVVRATEVSPGVRYRFGRPCCKKEYIYFVCTTASAGLLMAAGSHPCFVL